MTVREVQEALLTVNDPHIPVSIESMGMVREVRISESGVVDVELAIPCLACPGVSMLKQAIKDAIVRLEGVSGVNVLEGWHHDWTTQAIDPLARQQMRLFGIQV